MFDKDVIMLQVGFYRCFFFQSVGWEKKNVSNFFLSYTLFCECKGFFIISRDDILES